MITLEHNGETYETQGYRNPHPGDLFMGQTGEVIRCTHQLHNCLRMIVRPVRQEYVFGGVRFRETGEYRIAEAGEWALNRLFNVDRPYFVVDRTTAHHIILEPC